jgi:adenylosuccinate synthase
MDELAAAGVGLDGRVRISEACPLILPYHTALDVAREAARGAGKIGTTGRGIGPAYEDKVARRAIRLQDLLVPARFAAKLEELLDYHNFALTKYLNAAPVDFASTRDEALAMASRLAPLVTDVPRALYEAHRAGKNLLFEGAQGSLLDVDHGTYPFVTSSNCVAGAAAAGAGVGPQMLHYVLGITKAYTTRVGSGPFPTELENDTGERLRARGNEFGATTGRKRRCGWLDMVLVRQSVRVSGITGLAITKLDVLTGIDKLKICVGYRTDKGEEFTKSVPADLRVFERCQPVYMELDGWTEDINSAKRLEDLPRNTRRYVDTIENLCGVKVVLVSVGADRNETIVTENPFRR